MYIKKWPKAKRRHKYTILNIIQKCPKCGTVVEIDSLNDLEYCGTYSLEGGFLPIPDHRYHWKYVCPYCNKKEDLSDNNMDYVTKFIDSNGIDMKPYDAMEFISFKPDTYEVFYALWLHEKYGVQIHESLVDTEAAAFYQKHFAGGVLTRGDWFIGASELSQILDELTRTDVKETTKNLLDKVINYPGNDADRITKVMRCKDADGRTNYCIQTNGPYCILLVVDDHDDRVINKRILPRNYADKFYSRPAVNFMIK